MSDRIILKGHTKLLKPVITQIMAIHQLIESKDIGTIYGEPSREYQVRRKFKPQVELFFKEDEEDVQVGYTPVEGKITFRIMGEETNTLSNANLTTLARKVKEVFGVDNGYIWRKGKELYSYSDWDKGYQLQLLSRSESNARELILKVLSIQTDTFVLKNMQLCKNQDELIKYPYEPPTQIILGKSVKVPRYRPNVEVRFQYAAAHIHGLPNPKLLYSRTRNKKNALVV
ncbi:hypothetical protein [Chlorogloea sp. CCALA 695]|uniref:hypothetical protein n=1 Tax=Chlorogloea sp. CCALA 695 TaxID=2107693 RepID=UPI000D05B671|nr:hypothetical protein [Chlorogloea sp. CCALA 695]PSB32265.1 hypothetical protein C7B70_10900 [Chlorogloea sp. CCALA 695]